MGDVDWEAPLRSLIDEYRDRCLWFLARDYYPTTPAEALSVLAHIERSGDLKAFRQARQIREWLSRNSSVISAGF